MSRLVILGIVDAIAVALGLTIGLAEPITLPLIVVGWLGAVVALAWRA